METLSSAPEISIKGIFKANWPNYLATHRNSIPDYVITTVMKMLSCRDPEKLGCHKYGCPDHPDRYIVVPHSCKCRFCDSCGRILTDRWVEKINSLFPDISFHHLCFILPKELRKLLKEYRFLLNCLFIVSKETVFSFCKERKFLPTIVSSLHTFGRDLKDNPHIHMLISSRDIDLIIILHFCQMNIIYS